jgi:hypothetical protein
MARAGAFATTSSDESKFWSIHIFALKVIWLNAR